jgi:AraC-like DNA-binding protein
VNLQLAGTCAVRQGGRDDVVRSGEFTVLDTTEPYYLEFPTDWRMVSFRVPHGELSPRLRQQTGALGVGVDSRSGPGRVVSGLMRSLWQLGASDGIGTSAASGQWEQSFAAAVAGAVLDQVPEVADGDLREVIERYVHANLASHDLSVRAVAARFGISPRSLHKLFSAGDQSFGGMVRRARLQRCAEVLADPACAWTVGEVGVRNGFGDPTSFSRAFRREFGIAPGEVRRSRGSRDS